MADTASMTARRTPRHANTSPRKSGGASFASVMGELLCTLGVVIILYVIWQLYWTTWMVQGNVNEALENFHSQYSTTSDSEEEPEHRTDDPPAVGEVTEGEIYAVLHVPQWNWMQIPVAEGTESSVLDLGYAGHYVTTQQAGEVGNFALAGHRRTYGNNFRRVDILRAGDQMVVETKDAYLIYEVVDYEIVQPNASEVLYAVPYDASAQPTERLMTMTTCHPEYGNTERYIVYSKMVYWTDKAEGVPSILKDEPEVGGEFTDATDSAADGAVNSAASGVANRATSGMADSTTIWTLGRTTGNAVSGALGESVDSATDNALNGAVNRATSGAADNSTSGSLGETIGFTEANSSVSGSLATTNSVVIGFMTSGFGASSSDTSSSDTSGSRVDTSTSRFSITSSSITSSIGSSSAATFSPFSSSIQVFSSSASLPSDASVESSASLFSLLSDRMPNSTYSLSKTNSITVTSLLGIDSLVLGNDSLDLLLSSFSPSRMFTSLTNTGVQHRYVECVDSGFPGLPGSFEMVLEA